MNYKLAQFFLACRDSNFICWIHWNTIYHADDVTEEDKKIFLHWSNNVEMMQGRESFVFFDKKYKDRNPCKEGLHKIPMNILQKIRNDKNVKQDIREAAQKEIDAREKIKRDYSVNSIRCKKSNDAISGWLSPQGKFYNVTWGEHESWAGDYVFDNKLHNDKKEFEIDGGDSYYKDFLIHVKRFILIDNPEQDGAITVSYKTMTKAQKEFIMEYAIKIKDENALKEIENV